MGEGGAKWKSAPPPRAPKTLATPLNKKLPWMPFLEPPFSAFYNTHDEDVDSPGHTHVPKKKIIN